MAIQVKGYFSDILEKLYLQTYMLIFVKSFSIIRMNLNFSVFKVSLGPIHYKIFLYRSDEKKTQTL